MPAGATLRAYSPLAMGRAGLPLVDELYFWPPNTDPVLARAVLARNFSAISSGVRWEGRGGAEGGSQYGSTVVDVWVRACGFA